ncbi:hypothetical protein P7D85_03830 [Enterococcus hulanensis]|uniref:Uncharacterized protein n=1 Tax=Enterococcus hulanensis TaxID=2559929 RepID=A0ABU3EVK4_9ENTE|nr:hypothetical protein [Enterococcus hulanensis]MDT2598889.1 hypothetical protein [Enterococcus hulanensis]MDT2610540.1 hypothetical protein [Enterococcus hulanensis]MDT2614902.1 hypothetical protein [Enterococcus hulanensis]MDT2627128.1 hypothetical protein [Enterococcus hulanensis]MDT2653972.1 hypothetical protein [Enterococcus hulanensis]
MDVAKLGQRQLFLMKWENLEGRILKRFEQSQNDSEVIEYLVAVLVRSALCSRVISETLQALIRELFLTSEPNDTLRRYAPYFEEYCEKSEWKTIIKRLFRNEADYLACTKEARGYKDYLIKEGTLDIRQENHAYIVESFFEDMNGKRHKLTIREVDPNKAAPVVTKLLQILTTLTIFETNGVRKFVKFINYEGSGKIITTAYDTRLEEAEETVQEMMNEKSSNDTNAKNSSRKTGNLNQLANERKQTTTPHDKGNVTPTPAASKPKSKPKKPSKTPKKSDTAYLRYGKTNEQIDKEREKRRLEREKNKVLGKKKRKKK